MCAKRRMGDFATKSIAYNNLSCNESLLKLQRHQGNVIAQYVVSVF